MNKKTCILSFDDFCDNTLLGQNCDRRDLLFKLKEIIPHLKVNLFTIIGKCSYTFIKQVRDVDWFDILPHGMRHNGKECLRWSYDLTNTYLMKMEALGLNKIWKSPGYHTSIETYKALRDNDFCIADTKINRLRHPQGLKVYEVDAEGPELRVNGHMVKCLGDFGIERRFSEYAMLGDYEFKFIREII